jgi:hypothetical protein
MAKVELKGGDEGAERGAGRRVTDETCARVVLKSGVDM